MEILRLTSCLGSSPLLEGRIFGREVSTEPNLALGRRWIQECIDNHGDCNVAQDDRPPTRLIHVDGSGPPEMLRLVETELETKYQYAALSYRWAPLTDFVTTRENYESRLKGFGLDELPLTLQHAVQAARKLGIPYLWMDSICIIQDQLDWEQECPKMATVYGSSLVTLAAECAADATAGFLGLRNTEDPNTFLSCLLQFRGLDGSPTGQVRVTYPRLRHAREYATSDPFSVLRTRGWTLQERILSPRILHFGSRHMYWECRKHTCFEALRYRVVGSGIALPKDFPNTSDRNELFKWWNELIEEYMTCALTYDTDKLPAISGIAAAFQKLVNSKYIAGMWEDDLPRALVWSRLGALLLNDQPASRPPSWSCVACNHPVRFECPYSDEGYHPSWKIIHVSLQLSGTDVFGRLAAGVLTLHGKIKAGLIGKFDFEPDKMLLCDIDSNGYRGLAIFVPDDPDEVDACPLTLGRSAVDDHQLLEVVCL